MNARGRSGPGDTHQDARTAQPSPAEAQLSPEARARLRALRSMGFEDDNDFGDTAGALYLTDDRGQGLAQVLLFVVGGYNETDHHRLTHAAELRWSTDR